MVVSRVFDRALERSEQVRPAAARVSASECSAQPPQRTASSEAPGTATPVESLFLRPAQQLPTGSLMSAVMEHRRTKAPTPEQKQQLRQLSWDTFDRKAVAQPKNGAAAKVVDLPVTFHNRIKSSGYGQSKQSARKSQRSASAAAAKNMRAMCAPTYAIGELPDHHQPTNDLREPTPLRFIKFSGDGSMFALGYSGGDHSIRCVKHPVRRYGGDGFSLVGHQGRPHSISCSSRNSQVLALCWWMVAARVNCIDFSCDNKLALSVSDDRSARLWKVRLRRHDPLCMAAALQPVTVLRTLVAQRWRAVRGHSASEAVPAT